jgi:hypothetical protein
MSTINDLLGFNPQETEAADSFESRQPPVPNGEYKAIVTKAERKNNKAGTGWFWELTFTITETEEYNDRTVIHRFNIMNQNETAMKIGRSEMKRFLECIGNLEPKNEDDMCYIPLLIEVKCRNSNFINKQGETVETINNEIVQIAPFPSGKPVASEPQKESPKNVEKSEEKTPPWRKKK